MSKAFIAGPAKYLPAAAVAFDGLHVVQLAKKAVDAVRREEARSEGGWLKKTRWCWLKDKTKAKARGYGTTRHFIAMSFLIAGKLTHLPGNPLQKASPLP